MLKQNPNSGNEPKKTKGAQFSKKSTLLCSFCGGKNCKHENWLLNKNSVIKGLNSDWINDSILAMQRPSNRIIQEFDIIEQFKEVGIVSIFNLQEPGEHPYCGDGIDMNSGFSYNPEIFMNNGIYFYNFGWKDMTTLPLESLMMILRIMDFALKDGNKVAVHCHAGRGRTGMVIVAWLMYHMSLSAENAIKCFQTKRKESLTKKSQTETLKNFEKYLNQCRKIFYAQKLLDLDQLINNQEKLYGGKENLKERNTCLILEQIFGRLETLKKVGIYSSSQIILSFIDPNHKKLGENWSKKQDLELKHLKESVDQAIFTFSQCEDIRIMSQLVLDFFEGLLRPAIRLEVIKNIPLQNNSQEEYLQYIKSQNISQFSKVEYFTLSRIVVFFNKLIKSEKLQNDLIKKLSLRFSVALLNLKKQVDNLFIKRTIILEDTSHVLCKKLQNLLLYWAYNYSENLEDYYLKIKSPGNFCYKKYQYGVGYQFSFKEDDKYEEFKQNQGQSEAEEKFNINYQSAINNMLEQKLTESEGEVTLLQSNQQDIPQSPQFQPIQHNNRDGLDNELKFKQFVDDFHDLSQSKQGAFFALIKQKLERSRRKSGKAVYTDDN